MIPNINRRTFLKAAAGTVASTALPLKMFLTVEQETYKIKYQGLKIKPYPHHRYLITKKVGNRKIYAIAKIDKQLCDVVPDKKGFIKQELSCHIKSMEMFEKQETGRIS